MSSTLFQGPCFGDLSPSQESASLPTNSQECPTDQPHDHIMAEHTGSQDNIHASFSSPRSSSPANILSPARSPIPSSPTTSNYPTSEDFCDETDELLEEEALPAQELPSNAHPPSSPVRFSSSSQPITVDPERAAEHQGQEECEEPDDVTKVLSGSSPSSAEHLRDLPSQLASSSSDAGVNMEDDPADSERIKETSQVDTPAPSTAHLLGPLRLLTSPSRSPIGVFSSEFSSLIKSKSPVQSLAQQQLFPSPFDSRLPFSDDYVPNIDALPPSSPILFNASSEPVSYENDELRVPEDDFELEYANDDVDDNMEMQPSSPRQSSPPSLQAAETVQEETQQVDVTSPYAPVPLSPRSPVEAASPVPSPRAQSSPVRKALFASPVHHQSFTSPSRPSDRNLSGPPSPLASQSSPIRNPASPVPQPSSPVPQHALTSPPRRVTSPEPLSSPPQSSPIRKTAKKLTSSVPNPKRPTVVGNQRQFKKLSTPFRPLQIKHEAPDSGGSLGPPAKKAKRETSPASMAMPPPPPPPKRQDTQKKHRTVRAAGQFKSPLTVAPSEGPSVRMTPTIQSLERKVQILKRALKIKSTGDEEILKGLAKQWTEAGREVAYQLWDLVKENGASSNSGGSWGSDSGKSAKRGFQDSWGWEEKGDNKRLKTENWGWDEAPAKQEGTDEDEEVSETSRPEQECEDKVDFTLGLMLRQFGIDPDTLGWNEEDGMFVDK